MPIKIHSSDLSQLKRTADRLEEEAQTWREGFACYIDGRLHFAKDCEFAEIRYKKLISSSAYIRRLIVRIGPTEPEYYI